ncbi:MAG: pilus assembly protein PilB, partial [Planctomycetaceae bacterium]
MAIKKLGQILSDLGLIDEQQLATMLTEQASRAGTPLGKVGVELGFFTEEQLGEALAEQWGTTFVTLYDRPIPGEVLKLISAPMAQLYRVVPLSLEGERLTIASAEPQKIQIADELRTLLGYDIHVCVATESEIAKAVDKLYAAAGESVESLVDDLESDDELAA